jgi:hypothetical protein
MKVENLNTRLYDIRNYEKFIDKFNIISQFRDGQLREANEKFNFAIRLNESDSNVAAESKTLDFKKARINAFTFLHVVKMFVHESGTHVTPEDEAHANLSRLMAKNGGVQTRDEKHHYEILTDRLDIAVKSFISAHGEFAVSIAKIVEQEPDKKILGNLNYLAASAQKLRTLREMPVFKPESSSIHDNYDKHNRIKIPVDGHTDSRTLEADYAKYVARVKGAMVLEDMMP